MHEVINVRMTTRNNTKTVGMRVESNTRTVGIGSTERVVNGGGTRDYSRLNNKPAIDNHELRAGNNTLEEIGVQVLSNMDLFNILN